MLSNKERWARYVARHNICRKVDREHMKPGPKEKVSYEVAIDAFGRWKDGETLRSICAELGVCDWTLRKAFERVGLIERKAKA